MTHTDAVAWGLQLMLVALVQTVALGWAILSTCDTVVRHPGISLRAVILLFNDAIARALLLGILLRFLLDVGAASDVISVLLWAAAWTLIVCSGRVTVRILTVEPADHARPPGQARADVDRDTTV